MRRLAFILALLVAQAAGNPPGPLLSEQAVAAEPLASRLSLLFSANISAACAGRCSLRAVATPCGGGSGGEAGVAGGGDPPAASSVPAALEGWNTLTLAGGAHSQSHWASVHVECTDPACTAQPRNFTAWGGSGNCTEAHSGPATAQHPPLLPLEADLLPGLPEGHMVYLLNGKQPVVHVAFEPLQSLAAVAAPTSEDGQGQEVPRPPEACNASTQMQLPEGKTQLQQCSARSLMTLRLALAAWVLAVAGLGASL